MIFEFVKGGIDLAIDIVQITVLLFNAISGILAIAISYLFMLKIKRARGTDVDQSTFIGICFFYFFASLQYFSWFYYFYFKFEFSVQITDFYKFSCILGYIAVLGLVFFTEKMSGKTKYSFTILSFTVIIIGIIIPLSIEEIAVFSIIIVPIMLLGFFINFLIVLIIRVTREIRRKMLISFLLIIGVLFFGLLDTDFGYSLFPIRRDFVSIIAMIGTISTSLGMAKFFLSFETFTEFGWKAKMRELFIIAPNGVTLLYHSFEPRSSSQSTDLVTAGLTGVQELLKEMIQSDQKLQTIDHQDLKILFEYGGHSTIALVVHENLRIYRSKLVSLSTQFENLFQDVLAHWIGDVEVFLPAKQLINEIFG